jgi:hypothetical protein
MKVYILVLLNSGWNEIKKYKENYGKELVINNNQIWYYESNDKIVCVVKNGFNIPPNELWEKLGINQPEKVLIIHRHGSIENNWFNYKRINDQGVGNFASLTLRESNLTWTEGLDPLIIIFTYDSIEYPEWKKVKEIDKNVKFYNDALKKLTPKNNHDKEEIRIAEFKVGDYTVLFVKENDYVSDKNKKGKTKNGINALLSRILNKYSKSVSKEDIYVAVHSLSDYATNKDVGDFKNKFNDRVGYICDFHHYNQGIDKDFCDLLVEFLDVIDNGKKAEEKCEEIIKKIKELSRKNVNKFLDLEHKIKNIFLSLDIFLQDVNKEIKNDKDYLNNILKEGNEEKLKKLWYMVAKYPKDSENDYASLLVEREAIIDLIKEKKKDKYLKKYWKLLLKICGLNSKNNSLKTENISYDENSPILEFMKLLDSKKNKKSVEESDIKEIIGFFKNKNWEIKGADPEVIKSFHDWVSALGNCLKKIGEE